jgi:hypothetical protein
MTTLGGRESTTSHPDREHTVEIGIVGLLVVIALILAIVYFARRV